jgi:ATP adenylyltransferase
MDYLWSPWRMKYIEQNQPNPQCIFCSAVAQTDGPENLIVARGKLAFVILNRFPYTSGHIMVVPYEHQSTLEDLNPEIRSEIIELSSQATGVLRLVYHPDGYNLGSNIGSAAGAGIADHVHFHIVPRWGGDTNFMSTVASARVLPESLEQTYWRLREAWESVP